jgi:hypothetical protein
MTVFEPNAPFTRRLGSRPSSIADDPLVRVASRRAEGGAGEEVRGDDERLVRAVPAAAQLPQDQLVQLGQSSASIGKRSEHAA